MTETLQPIKAPFPYFGGKRTVATEVWQRLGRPLQYIEPFCGSAAILLSAPAKASLEVIGDANFYVANFWRCIKFQPQSVYTWQDYPVSHVDLAARHRWLTAPEQTASLAVSLGDPEWPGNSQIAGWWVWGQCCWIGSGWCEKDVEQIDHASEYGRIPHMSDAGRGVQSQIQHVSNAGRGVADWFTRLADRLERVRIIHGDWSRCLNHHYGGKDTAIFFDPPYRGFEKLYHSEASENLVADKVAEWCKNEADGCRIALCGHVGDYDLPGWDLYEWSRGRLTYGSNKTTDSEAIWFSPACAKGERMLL